MQDHTDLHLIAVDGASVALSIVDYQFAAGDNWYDSNWLMIWNTRAESLVTALMLVAANTEGRTISDVVHWVIRRDMPTDRDQGELAPLIRAMQSTTDPEIKHAVTFARDLLHGIWKGDERTTSSIYATDRAMLWAWTDPVNADACRTTDVDLAWLISGSNTLYLSTPPTDHERVAPVLSPTTTL